MAKIRRAPAAPHDGKKLFLEAAALDRLAAGWQKVFENGGAAGGDRVSCEAFGIGVNHRLEDLHRDLHQGSYHPGPLRQVDIPKNSGGVRRLSIPCIRDRVAQSAVAQTLSPLFEQEFEDVSFGYRPGRSVKQALARVHSLRDEGWCFTVDADIEGYFDNVPHDLLMDRLFRSISESPLTSLISLWLETGADLGRGLAQGSPLSPLLANLYLDDLDEALIQTPFRLVRFADDFVVLAKTLKDAEKAFSLVGGLLTRYGLAFNETKTRVRGFDDSLRFLGAVFVRNMVIRESPELGSETPERLLQSIAARDREQEQGRERFEAHEGAQKAAGYDKGVRTLYIHGRDRDVSLKNLGFAVYGTAAEPDGRAPETIGGRQLLAAIHPSQIDRMEIGPQANISTEALRNALAFGVEVAFVNGHGETLGTLSGPLPPRSRRHLAQARHILDPGLRLACAKLFVLARLRNQRALLRRLNQRRGLELVDQICSQFVRPLRAVEHTPSQEALMGHEGEATARFWRAWSALLLHGWSLDKRRRRPARDPVNIALNCAASLLERDARNVILAAGLHPGLGMLHSVDDGRDALVYDFMEIFRVSLVESVVLEAFNTRMLRPEHFEPLAEGQRMTNSGFAAIVRAYEERACGLVASTREPRRVTWRRLMLEQAQGFAAHLEEGRSFEPHVISY